MFLFLIIFICTTIVSDCSMMNTQNQEMSSMMTKRAQPMPKIRRHHRFLLVHRLLHHPKRRFSTTSKTKSFSAIASIRNSIHKSRLHLIKLFLKLGRNKHHKGGIPFLQQEETLFEADISPGLKLLYQTRFALPQVRVLNKHHPHKLLPPLASDKKRTIVLDLDETLVHSSPDLPPPTYDFMIKPSIDGISMNFYVLKRPGVDEFLETISKKYEVVVFTAGLEPYASMLLDILDPKGLISHRLYRDSCWQVRGRFVKDLSKIGRDLRNVVIVDDNPIAYSLQPANAIPIERFEGDTEDRELEKLMQGFFERYYEGFEDMRDAVNQYRWSA